MAQVANKTAIEIAKEKYDVALKKANDALNEKPVNLVAYNSAINELNVAEKEYATCAATALYDECKAMENPIIEIIKCHSFLVYAHKEERSKVDNSVTMVSKVTRFKQIDLLAFCKRAGLLTDWANTASKFNQLMCLRAATQLGVNKDGLKEIAKSYYMQDKVRQIEMGATPTSNNQVCKLLQRIIDEMLPNEDDDGKQIYKCNNHDVAYLDDLYSRKGKEKLTVRVANDGFLRKILVDIAHRLICDGKYGVDGYRKVKNAD